MARLQISYDELRQAASVFDTQSGAINDALNQVKGQVDNIQAYWESTTEGAFMEEWSVTYPKAVKLCEMLAQHAQALRTTADKLEAAEQDAAAGIRATISAND
ncbi:MAG: WXG100 family type VII secretion target [Chloroflexota bacterium]